MLRAQMVWVGAATRCWIPRAIFSKRSTTNKSLVQAGTSMRFRTFNEGIILLQMLNPCPPA